MIVADTNLLLYLYVQGQRTEESEAVLKRDAVWAVPLVWRSEFRNGLIGLVRTAALQLDEALTMVEEAERWLTRARIQRGVSPGPYAGESVRVFGLRL